MPGKTRNAESKSVATRQRAETFDFCESRQRKSRHCCELVVAASIAAAAPRKIRQRVDEYFAKAALQVLARICRPVSLRA